MSSIEQTGTTLFEGMTSIRAVLSAIAEGASDRRIKCLYYTAQYAKKHPRDIPYLRHRAEEMGFSLSEVSEAEIDALTSGHTHGGIAAECTERTIPLLSPEHILPHGFYMMLEGIEDPFNFGYAIRSIYAAGTDGIIIPPRNWMSVAGVVCRSSAGASELISTFVADAETASDIFRSRGYKIVCADLPDSVPVQSADLSRPLFLIVGGEKRGISRKCLEKADAIVRIDYGRDFSASLSAASAAAILSYEVARQASES